MFVMLASFQFHKWQLAQSNYSPHVLCFLKRLVAKRDMRSNLITVYRCLLSQAIGVRDNDNQSNPITIHVCISLSVNWWKHNDSQSNLRPQHSTPGLWCWNGTDVYRYDISYIKHPQILFLLLIYLYTHSCINNLREE